MRIRIFDITWRVNRPELPDVIEYPVTLPSNIRKFTACIGEGLSRCIHNIYLTKPIAFRYVLGNSHRVFKYEYSERRG